MRLASFWDRLSRQQSGMASPQIRGGTYGHWRFAAPSAAQLPVAAHGQTVPPTPPDPACRRQATTPGGRHASQAAPATPGSPRRLSIARPQARFSVRRAVINSNRLPVRVSAVSEWRDPPGNIRRENWPAAATPTPSGCSPPAAGHAPRFPVRESESAGFSR